MIEMQPPSSPFVYPDTATIRAGIKAVSQKLVGGTGSYILDQVAKTPADAIYLIDGDIMQPHDAFRSPSAASLDDATGERPKVEYFARIYGWMHSKDRRALDTPHPLQPRPARFGRLRVPGR